MWRFHGVSVPQARSLIDAAFGAGITLFDTADIYGFNGSEGFGDAETLLGQVFSETPGLRSKMVLATKGGIIPGVPYNSSAEYLSQALDASLSRLQVEHVDLWQIHRPDILTHPDEIARALQDMVTTGKVGAVGVSNFTQAQIAALRAALDIPLVSSQPEFSPLHLDPVLNGEFDDAVQNGMAILAWSPLGGGRIASPSNEREQAVAQALDQVASQFDVSRAVAAFSWVAAHPARPIPIVGSQTAQRIGELADLAKVEWTRSAWYSVMQASMGKPLP
ncbi:aldo/keto reductase [Altererythrobacter luteolus]|uniref:Aldo/keto reductase n=2 Tax=Pontixanthobacter luteolus TaxID=295089 RepID=A0A6I4V4N9_9SPHN|nr:aldo/keto reductase [Pontixanthobacter luteolus]